MGGIAFAFDSKAATFDAAAIAGPGNTVAALIVSGIITIIIRTVVVTWAGHIKEPGGQQDLTQWKRRIITTFVTVISRVTLYDHVIHILLL